MDPWTLWDDYGIVADVEVSCIGMLDIFDNNDPIFVSCLQLIFLVQIYTSWSHQIFFIN